MPPHADFVVISHDGSLVELEIKEDAIIAQLDRDLDLYYNGVKLRY